MSPTVYNRVLLFLSNAGIFVAGVLSMAALSNQDVPCGASGGCHAVAADPSSHLLGPTIANAYIGFFGYVFLAGLAAYRELFGIGGSNGRLTVYIGYVCSAVGTLASMALTFISITKIRATCAWCLGPAVIMTASLLTYMLLAMKLDTASDEAPRDKYGWTLVPIFALASVMGIAITNASLEAPDTKRFTPTAQDRLELIGPDTHVMNGNGVVTVVEFGDLDCPNCKRLYPQLEQAVANSNGKLRYAFHSYPLYMNTEHVGALPGAVISEMAAEHGQFWKYLDLVYSGSDAPSAPMANAEDMIKFGTEVGLSEEEMRRRLPDPNDPARLRVMNDLGLVRKFNIDHTPTFIVMAKGVAAVQVSGNGIFDVLKRPEFDKLLNGN